jgi:hypothetical protein
MTMATISSQKDEAVDGHLLHAQAVSDDNDDDDSIEEIVHTEHVVNDNVRDDNDNEEGDETRITQTTTTTTPKIKFKKGILCQICIFQMSASFTQIHQVMYE